MRQRATTAQTLAAILEVTPRTAKLAVASSLNPLRIERLIANTMPQAQEEDPVAALRTLLSTHALGTRQVGLVIGRETFSLQTLELPSSNPQEIASMLDLQLGKLTPYPRAEILSAYAIVGSFREGYTTVLLAITRKPVIEGILQLLKAKGVSPTWIGVSSEGLAQWWMRISHGTASGLAPDGLLALIDVDATSTDCVILSGAGLVFSHSVALGREQLASSEQAKARWVGELARLPRILLHEDIKGTIGRGVVCGVPDGLKDLTSQLAGSWNVEIEATDPLTAVAVLPSVGQAAKGGLASFASLVGFFASGQAPRLDLIPHETRVYQALQVRARSLARLAGGLVAVVVLVAVLYLQRIMVLQAHLTKLEEKLLEVEQRGQILRHMEETMRAARTWLNPKRGALEILGSLGEGVDPQIVIVQVAFEEGKPLTIRGRAQTTAAAYAFFERLEGTGLFASVESKSVARAKGPQAAGWDFEVLCSLKGS